MSKQPLLTDYNLNGLKLPNRVVMAPMTRSRADNPENAPSDGSNMLNINNLKNLLSILLKIDKVVKN